MDLLGIGTIRTARQQPVPINPFQILRDRVRAALPIWLR